MLLQQTVSQSYEALSEPANLLSISLAQVISINLGAANTVPMMNKISDISASSLT
jgi:hypothetical protein